MGCNKNEGYIVVGKTIHREQNHKAFLSLFMFLQIKNSEFSMTDHWVCNQSNTTGATRGAGTVYLVGAPKLLVGFMLLMLSYIHYVKGFKVCNTIHYIISGVIVGVIEWYLALQLPMQSVPITTKVRISLMAKCT